jgi:hypothetical protein
MYRISTCSSSDSGLGDGIGEGSALHDFYKTVVPRLELVARKCDKDLDDPTIDLEKMEVINSQKKLQPPPVQRQQQQLTKLQQPTPTPPIRNNGGREQQRQRQQSYRENPRHGTGPNDS